MKVFVVSSLLSAEVYAQCRVSQHSEPLTQSHMLKLMTFPRFESVDAASSDLNIQTRTCYKVSGCSEWQDERNSSVKSILTHSNGLEISRQSTLKFTAKKDLAWASFVLGWTESMLFVPSTSGSDRTIIPNILLLGKPIAFNVLHASHCVKVSAQSSRLETTVQSNTKTVEAWLFGEFEF